MAHVPPPIRIAAGLASLVLGLSVIYGMTQAFGGARPNWAVFGFEAITLLAAGFGLVHARGRFLDGPALLYANIVAVVVIGTGLSLVSLGFPPRQVLVHPFMLGRLGLAGVYAMLAIGVVFRTRRSSWQAFAIGTTLTMAALGLGGLAWVTRGSWFMPTTGIARIITTTGALLGAVVLSGLFCAGVHFVIRAFELGHAHNAQPGKPAPARTPQPGGDAGDQASRAPAGAPEPQPARETSSS